MSQSALRSGATVLDGTAGPPTRRTLLALAALGAMSRPATTRAAPQGQLTYGVHVSLPPAWFDPAETTGIITPFMLLYALHDGMVKAMPGTLQAPCLAESFDASEDGLTYDFVIRQGARFHNGEPVTSDDVRFSFERYRGASQSLLKQRVAAVETPDARHVRFRLKEPWPDFLTFYAGATGAAWIVPRRYVAQVGDDGFKKAPIGAGPYRFVSFTPGVELVLEAFDQYWRATPRIKRIVMKVIPDESTRLAALKRGEIDIAYSIRGELAGELKQTPGLDIKPVVVQGTFCVYFADQWDAKSPWHDLRVRRAANLAIDRQTINEALTMGFSHVTNSAVFPDMFEFYWQPPAAVYDPGQAKQALAAAGFPNGFDAGFYYCDSSYANIAEAVVNNLGEVGIRCRLRPIERAAFLKGFADKAYKNLIQAGPGAFGNAATRLESLVVQGGPFAYGSYPDIDALFPQQAVELHRTKRTELLHRMQQMVHERAMYAPIWQLAFINGIGPRVAESGFGHIPGFPYTAPYEDLSLKGG
ncbi:MAG: ABC transporter substrate-binding protein [Acetobacteraceae bacterium]